MTANDTIAAVLDGSGKMLNRFVADLTPQEMLHRAQPEGNCTAWLIGHLINSDRGALKALATPDLPGLPEGFDKRFSREPGVPQAADFGDVTTLMPLFNQHRERLLAAVRSAPAALLDKPLEKPHPMFSTVGQFVSFMALHTAIHTGQITMIRRSLGRPPMV